MGGISDTNYFTLTAFEMFMKLEHLLTENNLCATQDYAITMESLAKIYLSKGNIEEGTARYKKALAIYEEMYADEPELLEEKKIEIQTNYTTTGLLLGQALLNM